MTIDWISFTPGPALLGGILLGIAAALYILFNGRILGISGIVGGLLQAKKTRLVMATQFYLWFINCCLMGYLCIWYSGKSSYWCRLCNVDYCWPSCGLWGTLRIGMYQRPWYLWSIQTITTLFIGNHDFYGLWLSHGLCSSSPRLRPWAKTRPCSQIWVSIWLGFSLASAW